tara:strand:+ start:325 stop:1569 length:1245 start_codon:yes stop_codon:yes gene_type:complete
MNPLSIYLRFSLLLFVTFSLQAGELQERTQCSVGFNENLVYDKIGEYREVLDQFFGPLTTLNPITCMEFHELPCFENTSRVAVFDVGSTGIRVAVADIYPSSRKIDLLDYFKYPMEFGVHKGNAKDRIAAIGGLREAIETVYGGHGVQIKYEAVATAGFRAAGNYGHELACLIEFMTDVHFRVIDQEEEASLAFSAALMHHPEVRGEDVVVWDIGGGSMQFAVQSEDGGLTMAGCRVAARTFMEMVFRAIKSDITLDSPNPIKMGESKRATALAKKLLTKGLAKDKDIAFDSLILEPVRKRVDAGATVFGVGGVHTYLVLGFVQAILGTKNNLYTKKDLLEVIETLVESTDDEILNLAYSSGNTKLDSPHSVVTSILLVYAAMDDMGIETVHVVPADNTDGLLARAIEGSLREE